MRATHLGRPLRCGGGGSCLQGTWLVSGVGLICLQAHFANQEMALEQLDGLALERKHLRDRSSLAGSFKTRNTSLCWQWQH